eukprot:4050399-Pyramimonas_sp.AAC.1
MTQPAGGHASVVHHGDQQETDKGAFPLYGPDPWKPWPTCADAVKADLPDQHDTHTSFAS